MYNRVLIDYKLLRITFQDLKKIYGNPYEHSCSISVVISKNDILNAIRLYETNTIDIKELICWADVVRFSGLYTYPDDLIEQEQVATAIDMIEDIELFDICVDDIYFSKIKNILKM